MQNPCRRQVIITLGASGEFKYICKDERLLFILPLSVLIESTFKVYMEIGSSFLFLQEQIKDIIIILNHLMNTHQGNNHDAGHYQ
jgi:hypothetical protein